MPEEPRAPELHPQAAQTLRMPAPWGKGAGSSLTGCRVAILVVEVGASLISTKTETCPTLQEAVPP